MGTEKCRLFVALWPDADVLAQLAEHTAVWSWSKDCVPYDPADWHLTLQFIGDVPRTEVENIGEGLRVPFEPFGFELDWPHLWSQGLAVLTSTALAPELQTLHARLQRAMHTLSLQVEPRPYSPHVTLARHAGHSRPPAAATPIMWRVRDYVLAESLGKPVGRYQILRRYRAPGGTPRR